ncbi:myo-inositol-1(or 4)-monophosphatase [Nocardioides alpinus]|uniref:Inositol-1-monophosphatase n=2 Tax=Nocardioides alpinus TaxID=748909 RepID=A0A1I1B576_9ACTN|nr:inositol monophosphatase family protein [Nocardioides alpinus]SFB43750.1 myo-inositol-1(or 4)-monophosphatase [Nocardioides alpinus]
MSASAPELRDLARAIAHEGANLAREMQLGGIDVADTKTSVVDVVTEADRAVETLIRERISALRPDDAILGEEGDDLPGTSGVRWIVDPIDGTVNYLYGLPDCAVSVAVEVDGEVVAGAVVTIPTGLEYAAALGHGSTRDGQPIGVRRTPPLAERLVLTGFGYQRAVREHQAGCVARLLPEVRDIRRMGSCALDLCHVAEGSADGYVEAGPQPWDHSAGGLVLREAGGRFDLLDGKMTRDSPSQRNVVVGAPADGWDTFVEALGAAGFLA